jgi:DNA-binding SARP family transcriptional activator
LEFRVLGPLQVVEGDRDVAPRRAKQRALLAVLLLERNEPVTTDLLIDALWGEEPPPTAAKALQGHVSALRKLLGADRIETGFDSYRLAVEPGELDADRFEAEVRAARALRDAEPRARRLADALALWRGEAFADLAYEAFTQHEITRLDGLRIDAFEELADAELALGRHVAHVPELERLVADHPLREALRGQLMLALYRSGRQADALRVFREGRRILDTELGIEPGAQLQALERRMLEQDPSLDLPVASRALPRQARKVVTLLVAEVVPDAAVDPEDLDRAAQPAIERVRRVVERHGGTAEPLFANAVLGVFGAPRAHDDDPLRAIRAALELGGAAGGSTAYRIGVESGEALVTMDGSTVAITGQVLAAASNLQATAPIGAIAVGPSARALTGEAVRFDDLAARAWRPTGLLERREAGTAEAPFVGRTDELALLERIHARADDERSVQLATVTAEPGGGKTRLVGELRRSLEALPTPPAWRQGRCLPYGDGVTYWALGEIVRQQAGILESDDSVTSTRKLAAAIAAVESDEGRRQWFERGLAALVGLDGAGAIGNHEQSFAVWRQFLEAIAAQHPLVILFEDIHWADAFLLEFIEHLVRHAAGVPLLVLCTARLELLEARPGWGGGVRNATTISLDPLSPEDTAQLIRSLTGRDAEPGTVRRASGNPLFAHELARILDATGRSSSGVIPDTLQAVIAARLDTLSDEAKAIAADAAVVGEVFWSGAVAAIGGLDEQEVERRLQRLVANDVARRRRSSSVARQGEYAFLHVLVRDVAYWQIPRRDRVAKHRAAAAWIEQLAGDRMASHAELIAHHYVQALDTARAVGDEAEVGDLRPRARTMLMVAGDAARQLETTQAAAYFTRALELTDAADPEHGLLLARLGESALHAGRLADAERLGREAVAELQAHGDDLGAGEATATLVATLWRLGRPEDERRRLMVKAIRTLEERPATRELALAYTQMARHELHAGRAEACGDFSKKALELATRMGLVAVEVPARHLLGILRFETGDEAGIGDIREAVRIGREAGLSVETATAQSNLAAVVWVTDGPRAALALKREAAEFALSRGLVAYEQQIRAEALWQQFDGGFWDDALASAEQLIATEGGSSRVRTMAQTVSARILAERGETDAAADLEHEYLDRARELRDPQDLGPALAAGAALRQALGDLAGAAELIAELERVTRGRDASQRTHELPHAARVGRESGTIATAEALVPKRGAPRYVRARLCLETAAATIAEAHGRHEDALEAYLAMAEAWRAFGVPAEAAHALLGQARCLAALDRPTDVPKAAAAARQLGIALGARLIIAEAERLIG